MPSSCSELQSSGARGLWCHQLEQDRSPGDCSCIDWGPGASSSSSSDRCIVCTILHWQTPISSQGRRNRTGSPVLFVFTWELAVQVRTVPPLCIDLAGLGRRVGCATCHILLRQTVNASGSQNLVQYLWLWDSNYISCYLTNRTNIVIVTSLEKSPKLISECSICIHTFMLNIPLCLTYIPLC